MSQSKTADPLSKHYIRCSTKIGTGPVLFASISIELGMKRWVGELE